MAIAIPCYAMFIIGIFCIYITDGTKRLLLNDPNQINSHLQQMEARVQSFENTISVLTNKIQSLEKTNSGLTNRVQSSENTISVLTNMVQSLEKSNSVLTSKHPGTYEHSFKKLLNIRQLFKKKCSINSTFKLVFNSKKSRLSGALRISSDSFLFLTKTQYWLYRSYVHF